MPTPSVNTKRFGSPPVLQIICVTVGTTIQVSESWKCSFLLTAAVSSVCASQCRGWLVKIQIAGRTPRMSDSGGQGEGQGWEFAFLITFRQDHRCCPRDHTWITPAPQQTPSQCLYCDVKWKSLSRVRLFATPWSPWNSSGQNTGVGSLSLLEWIFPTQESNQGLLHFRQILYQLSYQGRPMLILCSDIHHYFSINIFIMCTSLSRTVRIKYWIFLKEKVIKSEN